MPDLKLGFQINLVIILCAQTITCLRAVLTHHDDRRLNSSQTGKNQIKENERIGIECVCHEEHAVNGDPDEENRAEGDEKFPTATELGDVVGESLAERELFLELFAYVAGENLVLMQALDDFLVERGKFANLLLYHSFDVVLLECALLV